MPIALSWFITGSTLMYLGVHRFARLLKVKAGLWSSFWGTAAFALLIVAASTFIPHIPYPLSECVVDGIFSTYMGAGGSVSPPPY